MVAYWWRSGGLLVEMWRGLLVEMWWLIGGDVVAHFSICGGSLLEICGSFLDMWWLIVGDLVAHLWIYGGSFVDMWWFIC